MDSDESGSIALLSIHPQYVQRILDGSKRVEFRRTRFSKVLSHVVVYATSPDRKLVGYFDVTSMERGSPQSLWGKHRTASGISRQKLFDYLEGVKEAIAITIGTFHPFRRRLTLEKIGVSTAPQSFTYLDAQVISILNSYT
jgi:predicted transcriptional regulator